MPPSPPPSINPRTLPTPSLTTLAIRQSYRIGRGEQGVLSFEPYKSILLPFWRFRTVAIAKQSSQNLKSAFDSYVARGDFVGADMSRKFIQMGMTRARRYANYRGGRKYDVKGDEGTGGKVQREKSGGHEGQEEKAKASEIFKAVWRECLGDEEYLALKKGFVEEQKEWEREEKNNKKKKKGRVKEESDDEKEE